LWSAGSFLVSQNKLRTRRSCDEGLKRPASSQIAPYSTQGS
jgi:hypothetical protein